MNATRHIVLMARHNGNKVRSIKAARASGKLGLKEAVDMVRDLDNGFPQKMHVITSPAEELELVRCFHVFDYVETEKVTVSYTRFEPDVLFERDVAATHQQLDNLLSGNYDRFTWLEQMTLDAAREVLRRAAGCSS